MHCFRHCPSTWSPTKDPCCHSSVWLVSDPTHKSLGRSRARISEEGNNRALSRIISSCFANRQLTVSLVDARLLRACLLHQDDSCCYVLIVLFSSGRHVIRKWETRAAAVRADASEKHRRCHFIKFFGEPLLRCVAATYEMQPRVSHRASCSVAFVAQAARSSDAFSGEVARCFWCFCSAQRC